MTQTEPHHMTAGGSFPNSATPYIWPAALACLVLFLLTALLNRHTRQASPHNLYPVLLASLRHITLLGMQIFRAVFKTSFHTLQNTQCLH